MSETLVSIEENQEIALFTTAHGELIQSDKKRNFRLTFRSLEAEFKVCELIVFRKRIFELDIKRLLDSDTSDIEIIYLANCDKFFVVDVNDLIELRNLLHGAFAMLELNSIIHKSIVRSSI
ncbi:MAG: hypothetical protein AAGC88_00045 [Bacteroidota bacterium]